MPGEVVIQRIRHLRREMAESGWRCMDGAESVGVDV